MSNKTKIEYRDQTAKLRKIHDVVNKEGAVVGKKMIKEETAGVMASFGQWSAWGDDRVTALRALKAIRGMDTQWIDRYIEAR